jgi:predicted glutamine amidotransferase
MCRMLAFVSAEQQNLAPFLSYLTKMCVRGYLVDHWETHAGGRHPDGWGIVFRQGTETRWIRGGEPASADPALAKVRGTADRFVGHIRYASDTGTVNAGNAHPFLVEGIALAHNGTFRGRIGEEASARKVSDTLVFLERLADLWRDRTLDGLAATLSRLLGDTALVGDYSAANMLIAAGDGVFALRNFREDEEYYTLSVKVQPGLTTAASEPFDTSPDWRPLENGELVELCLPSPATVHLALPA